MIDQLTSEVAVANDLAGSDIVVRASLGTNGQASSAKWDRLRTPENLKLRKLHSAPIGTFQYEARLTGLAPATHYYYAVFDGERRLSPL